MKLIEIIPGTYYAGLRNEKISVTADRNKAYKFVSSDGANLAMDRIKMELGKQKTKRMKIVDKN